MGSGKLGKAGVAFQRILEQVRGEGAIEIELRRKVHTFDAVASRNWRTLFSLAAGCELAAAVSRTRAVAELVRRVDDECERRLRRRGLLGFEDINQLMGAWSHSEDARLCREAVDFRLDARYDHWLLDEFQETSAAQWRGVEPLLAGPPTVLGPRSLGRHGERRGPPPRAGRPLSLHLGVPRHL